MRDRESFFDLLLDAGALQFGDFQLTSGVQAPFYLDLRLAVSSPALLRRCGEELARLVGDLQVQRLAAVPLGGLPLGVAAALSAELPLLYTRKEVKRHGAGRQVEGGFAPGERVAVVEDLVTTGGSLLQAVELLRAAGLDVAHAVALTVRGPDAPANLRAAGIRLQAVFELGEVLLRAQETGRISAAQRADAERFMRQGA